MGKRIRISDEQVEELASLCLCITRQMLKSLASYGIPATTDLAQTISSSITSSLTNDLIASRAKHQTH
jgi:hypothetical protein